MTERDLLDKLEKIEALFAGTSHAGERTAASEARERISARLRTMQTDDPPIEMRFAVHDPWGRRLLLAMLRRYGIKPYRHRGQKRQSVMARVSKRFVDETLWPQFQAAHSAMAAHLAEVADRVIRSAVGDPTDEPELAGGDRQALGDDAAGP